MKPNRKIIPTQERNLKKVPGCASIGICLPVTTLKFSQAITGAIKNEITVATVIMKIIDLAAKAMINMAPTIIKTSQKTISFFSFLIVFHFSGKRFFNIGFNRR